MTFQVRTTVFEGPLDLLLQLIRSHQVEVTAVGLTEVVGEYLAFLEEMSDLDLDATSEFLLIATTLVQFKVRALFPTSEDIDLDSELALIEERDRLLSRLLGCVTFKDVAAVLRTRLQEANRFVPRISGMDQQIAVPPPAVDLPVDPGGLAIIAARVFSRADIEPDLDHLDLDLPSVESAINEIRARIEEATFATFDDLTEHCNRPLEVAAYFLALLELAHWGLVDLSQSDWSADIEVSRREGGDVVPTSEWAS